MDELEFKLASFGVLILVFGGAFGIGGYIVGDAINSFSLIAGGIDSGKVAGGSSLAGMLIAVWIFGALVIAERSDAKAEAKRVAADLIDSARKAR
ncbi:hypothetical protein [Burkholderia sp. MBR-1]|uniref:hypothetical protein n=1 Tax=Burkholderia sp. MBR-1 TaxID=2732364 RepID=UPI0015EF17E5|nr:hypothetical protein [Burkholderia sp. MBR-1]QMI49989.1 hypothetical protein MBR110_31575 [Burkholderia sp. MBR-1]